MYLLFHRANWLCSSYRSCVLLGFESLEVLIVFILLIGKSRFEKKFSECCSFSFIFIHFIHLRSVAFQRIDFKGPCYENVMIWEQSKNLLN